MALDPAGDDSVHPLFVRVGFNDLNNPIHRLLQGFTAVAGVFNTEYAT